MSDQQLDTTKVSMSDQDTGGTDATGADTKDTVKIDGESTTAGTSTSSSADTTSS